MKKQLAFIVLVIMAVSGCGLLSGRSEGISGTPAPKAQICPDDPMACGK